jgi:periplasmic divalent cation tolerance protein
LDDSDEHTATKFVDLMLPCGSWQEAHAIADALLEKHLIACAEFLPIKSRYWWKQQREEAEEIKLIMQSRMEHFTKVEAIVRKLHSYETPSLHAVPIAIISETSKSWLTNSTEDN